jgi:hypothetical protein
VDQQIASPDLISGIECDLAHNAGQVRADRHAIHRCRSANAFERRLPFRFLSDVRGDGRRRRVECSRFGQLDETLDLGEFHKSEAEDNGQKQAKKNNEEDQIFPEGFFLHMQ